MTAQRVAERAAALRIGGLVSFSATDYPGALAAVVFCQGCPWRCAYCHNPHLIPAHTGDASGTRTGSEGGSPASGGDLDFGRILEWLQTRRGLLDAVVFSGGEPTAQPGLADAIAAVRNLGFAIGLHTGGAYPHRLAQVLPLIDWIGLDVKAPAAEYANVTGIAKSDAAAFASLDLVVGANVPFEVRTTVHLALTPVDSLVRLAGELASRGVERWILQPFRPVGCTDARLAASATGRRVFDDALLARLRERIPGVASRA